MNASVSLGRIFGIPLKINYSWLIIFGLVILLMSSRYADLYPQWPVVGTWTVAVVTTALFFVSVLLHELSHSLVALARGIPVKGITLFIFGGVSELGHEARRPMSEFVVTIVGPATSLALAVLCGALWIVLDDGRSYAGAILFTLAAINLSLSLFNMLPGFPLDGGRVLRSAIWGITGNYWLATRVAIRAGQALGGLMVAGGVFWAVIGDFQGLWVSLVGGFLFVVASSNYREEAIRNALGRMPVGDALRNYWPVAPASQPAYSPEALMALSRANYVGLLVAGREQDWRDDAANAAGWDPEHGPEHGQEHNAGYGAGYGIVTAQDMTRYGVAGNQSITLGHLSRPLSDFPIMEATDSALEALELMDAQDVEVIALVRNGYPLGVVTRSDVLSMVRSRRREGPVGRFFP